MPKKTQQSRLSRGLRRAGRRLSARRDSVGPPAVEDPWWKHSITYEIYLRSFQDSDGDGVGDLGGLVRRLDYLEALGVNAIWITPFYPSPQVDFGYDISDYRAIDPRYGTLEDFRRLTIEAAKRGIRVLLDMVLNHTSDQHPWFVEAARLRAVAVARLLHLERRAHRCARQTLAAQQLGESVRRLGLGVRTCDRPVLLSQVLSAAARSQLA